MIRAVLFDMDGLLVDSEPFWRKAEKEAFAQVGIILTDRDCRETMGYRLNEVVALWQKRKPWAGPSASEVEADILRRVSHYILTEAQPLPGVLRTVDICRKAGMKTAVASSSPMQLIESTVQRFGLNEAFDLLHSAQDEPYGKPHPAVFISAARLLGVPAENCLVLEDSFHGTVAGLAAKMKVIAVPAPEDAGRTEFSAAHLQLESLEDFSDELLSKLV